MNLRKVTSLIILVALLVSMPLATGAKTPPDAADLAGGPDTPGIPAQSVTVAAPEDALWDNGPLVTHPAACNGQDASRLQGDLGMTTLGFGHQYSAGYRMADDFFIESQYGWEIDTITFYAYQSSAPTSPSPIAGVYYQIWNGSPDDPGSAVVFGDLVTNRLVSSTFSNVQRDSTSSTCANNRYIFQNVASAGVTLPPGAYWIDWMTDGSPSYSGPWAPPITVLEQTTTGNALQYTVAWAPALDTGSLTPQGMPFVVSGTPALPPQPNITVTPQALVAEQCPDTVTEQTVTICNTGDADLTWRLSEMGPSRVAAPQVAPVPDGKPVVPLGASSQAAVQPFKPRIAANNILHISTTSTGQSVQRALDELGYAYDLFGGQDWTGIDFSPYDVVVIGMDGGIVDQPSLLKIRTDVIDQGKRVVFMGGTCYQPFAFGVNDYLVANNANDYCWTVSNQPQFTVVQPGHPLAQGLPSPWNFGGGGYAGYYQLRVTDPSLDVIAVNGDGFDNLFYKNADWPTVEGSGPQAGGDLIWLINSANDAYWTEQADFDLLKQAIANSLTYQDAVPWLRESPTAGTVAPGECVDVTVTFDSTGLAAGFYGAILVIDSNDPDEPQVVVGVQMTVLECATLQLHLHRTKLFRHPSAPWWVRVVSQLMVYDQDGMAVEGATVTGQWTLPDGTLLPPESGLYPTDPLGRTKFRLQDTQFGLFTFCVTDISLTGYAPWPPGGYPGDAPACSTIDVQP